MLGEHFGAGASYAYQRSDGFPPLAGQRRPRRLQQPERQCATALHRQRRVDVCARRCGAPPENRRTRSSAHRRRRIFSTPATRVGADWQGGAGRTCEAHGQPRHGRCRPTADAGFRPHASRCHSMRNTAGGALDSRMDGRARWWRTSTRRSLSFGLPYDVHTHTTPGLSRRTSCTAAPTICCWRSATTITRPSARTRPGTSSSATLSIRNGARRSRSARRFMRRTAPTCTASAAIRRCNPRSRARASSACSGSPTNDQNLRLSAFQNDIDDLIDYVLIDPSTFTYQAQNVDRSRIRGAELDYEWQRRGVAGARQLHACRIRRI